MLITCLCRYNGRVGITDILCTQLAIVAALSAGVICLTAKFQVYPITRTRFQYAITHTAIITNMYRRG